MQVLRDRQGQRCGGKDKEDRDKQAGLYWVPSSQHKGQLKRQCTAQKSLSLVGHPDNGKPLLSVVSPLLWGLAY